MSTRTRITRGWPAALFAASLLLPPWPRPATAAQEVLATVNGRNITEADIAATISGQMTRLNQQIFQIKKQALDAAIAEQLLEEEAKKRGVTKDQLLQQEVNAKVTPVTEVDAEKWFKDNQSRLGGRKFADIKTQIQQQLQNERLQQQRQSFVRDLRKAADVKVMVEPPAVKLTLAGAPSRGPADAPVTIVEFSDYQWPYCARVQSELEKVRETYKDRVRVVFKDFPLENIHPNARKAAEAARCAGDQGKYWEYHDVLFKNGTALGVDNLKKFAADLKLDTAQFNTCLESGKHGNAVTADLQEGSQVGVSGTPAFFVNGQMLSGAVPFTAFQEMIEEALASR